SAGADALGVVAAEARMRAVDLLERVDEPGRRERTRRQPAAGVGERDAHARDDDAYQRQASEARGPTANPQVPVGRRVVSHGQSVSILPSVDQTLEGIPVAAPHAPRTTRGGWHRALTAASH